MFSFEGHYRKPRSINYGKQKDVGKKDLIENARSEREKRALLNRQIICATKIQKAYRQYLIVKENKKQSLNEFRQILSQISLNEAQFTASIIKSIDYLLIFFNSSNTNDDSLKSIVTLLITNGNIGRLFAKIPTENYYYPITLGLLLRLTARHLQSFPENAPSFSYNVFLRFLEIFYSHLSIWNPANQQTTAFQQRVLHIVLESCYFFHLSEFIGAQLLWRKESATEAYCQIKVKSILEIVLAPLEIAKNHNLLQQALLQVVGNIFSDRHRYSSEYRLKTVKLMTIAILDIVPVNIFIDIIYQNRHSSRFQFSSATLLLIISAVVDNIQISPDTAAKSLLLFYEISRSLSDDSKLTLSNDLPETPITTDESLDSLDFEMQEQKPDKTDSESTEDSDESDEDNEDNAESREERHPPIMSPVEREIAVLLKSKFCPIIVPLAIQADETVHQLIDAIGYLYHLLILDTKIITNSESKSFILSLIETSTTISRRLWSSAVQQHTDDTLDKSLMQCLIAGQLRSLIDIDVHQFFGKLLCFANCLHWRLLSVQDLDLLKIDSEQSSRVLEFSPSELCEIVLKLRDIMYGLLLLIYDSSKSSCASSASSLIVGTVVQHRQTPSASVQPGTSQKPQNRNLCNEKLVKMFIELQRVVTRLYNRDVRKGLQVSGKRLDWVKPDICRTFFSNITNQFSQLRDVLLENRYRFGRVWQPSGGAAALSATDLRQLVVLKEMPFIVPIGTRMKLFQQLLANIANSASSSSSTSSSAASVANVPPRSSIRVRRDFLYDDAFSQLSSKSFPQLRPTNLKIEFIDRFGILEPGVDGGGLLREFLSAILRDACDPKRGLFVATHDNLLYPNPELQTLYPDSWRAHLEFFGRMLGVTVSKGLLVDAPFAPFFLQKLFLSSSPRSIAEIDIDDLQSLDADLYRNLLSLKSMPSVEELGLDFTVSRSCCGTSTLVELKRNGERIPVTNSNRIEYIYSVADYKLNRQIAPQTAVIVAGLDHVVPVDWFQLFDLDEIAFMVTGNSAPIDLGDLRRNTVYHGVEDPEGSVVIRNFWAVLVAMSDEEKRNFVQFVTSISRPPVLGFGELSPKFAIQIVPDTERLPTASTCINLLKLPAYEGVEEMRQKLLYAIGSDSGFHLS